ncbi:hypothetical protein Gotur_031709 [Gossypium turneri]
MNHLPSSFVQIRLLDLHSLMIFRFPSYRYRYSYKRKATN